MQKAQTILRLWLSVSSSPSPEKYDLFHHNCNTFSNEVAQFLTSQTIPGYITDLPKEVLETWVTSKATVANVTQSSSFYFSLLSLICLFICCVLLLVLLVLNSNQYWTDLRGLAVLMEHWCPVLRLPVLQLPLWLVLVGRTQGKVWSWLTVNYSFVKSIGSTRKYELAKLLG